MDSKILNACGLWISKSQSGNTYMSGRMGDLKMLVFKNDKKGNEKAPDYRVCFTAWERKEEQGQERPTPTTTAPASGGNDDAPF
jgi:uncharacterized protein (DUF736 family)